MSPANVASLQQALLALLTLVLSILVPILAAAAKNWLDAHAKDKQLSAAIEVAHSIVKGIEQLYGDAAGPSKKEAATAALQTACPWLPEGVASVLVEAAVQSMNDLLDMRAARAAPPPPAEPPALIVPPSSLPIPTGPGGSEPITPTIQLPTSIGSSAVPSPGANGTVTTPEAQVPGPV